jgi:predicted flap endonuclease-1-like 5' DNA nuclease
MDWWIWLLLIVALVAITGAALWMLRSRTGRFAAPRPQRRAGPVPTYVPGERVKKLSAPKVPEADDLAAIEGIGPRIHDVLHEAGITTFAQLAQTRVDRLVNILAAAELPPADPTTWPEQARLAAESRWADLKTLQDTLKAGKAI